jgi:hypothetical protein
MNPGDIYDQRTVPMILGAVGEAGPRGLRVAAQIWALNQIYAYIFFVCATNPRPPTILETKRKEDVSK